MEEQDINLEDAKGIIGKMRSVFYGKLLKWIYVVIGIPGAIIAYNFIKALEEKGFFHSFSATVTHSIDELKHLSFKCPSLIHDFSQFMNCLGF